MKKRNLILGLGAMLLLSASALTGCSTAQGSTDNAATQAQTSHAASESETGAAANRLEDILNRGYIEVATEPAFAPNEFIDPT